MKSSKKENIVNIFLNVEGSQRELDYKLFLVGMLAGPNRRIFLGENEVIFNLISKKRFRGGVLIGKHWLGLPPSKEHHYHAMKSKKIDLMFIDEEGAIYRGNEEISKETLKNRVLVDRMDENDVIFTWGNFQKRVHDVQAKGQGPRIVCTGHPRFDLYEPQNRFYFQNEIDTIHSQYGQFILINSNFSFINDSYGLAFALRCSEESKLCKNLTEQFLAITFILLGHFINLVCHLSDQFCDKKIIFRPHPSENINFYQTIFSRLKNVHVTKEGSVTPWIMASQVVIHNGCTTAIETFLAQKPLISYTPIEEGDVEIKLPNRLGVQCKTPEAVIRAIGNLLKNQNNQEKNHRLISDDYESLSNFSISSFPLFLECIEKKINKIQGQSFDVPSNLALKCHGIYLQFRYYLTHLIIKWFFPEKYLIRKNTIFNVPLSKKNIAPRLALLSQHFNKKLDCCKYFSKYFMVIEPE